VKAVVVIPTYNERDNLPLLLPGLLAHAGVRAIIVDDNSPDGTGEIADRLAEQWPGRVEVLHRRGRRGYGRSSLEGLQRALQGDAELVFQMDADLSHDPTYLPALASAATDADLVIGSRYVRGISVVNWPLRRIMLSTFANQYIRAVTRLSVRDCTSGFRCWRRAALAKLPMDRVGSEGYSFLVEMLYLAHRAGCRIVESPIIFIERREGVSKMSPVVMLESALTPWRLLLTR
jgi:dolichol-phosphate mannosyltransferase